ncbi:MAG: transporter substrate-binding domain-containing protein [Rhodobacter sp.]|uniref:transporter substrate-binding domain-containing protein n=1 Tax=Pararhodobacter sp. TaxID=2127056 RepID=UPI001E0C845E|nr:transporter substrate-binding domain-containing protein [Pararhodobacter sp.]MCB1345915.1 transporter substrate-binding domain-containing protein [Paracoccaceae bacterium]MCC0074760.1 transporter substrate-binding domain-containing protein [Rhodobacter sp.]HPD93342.1 transporter substrate-binding domain-containing protein [Pararhodobacter sp.]
MKNLALTAAVLALTASGALAQQVIRMGTEGAYPPYNYLNESNELVGFEIDLGNALCARANLTCEWVQNDWDSIIPNLVAGNYDTIMAGMNATPARAEVIAFSEAYKLPDPSGYMALAGTDPAVMESGVIAAQSNTVQASMVAETSATLIEFPTADETIAAVRNGTADAVLADHDFLVTYVTESNGELAFLATVPTAGDGVSIGLRQSDEALRATFNAAIESMKADGSLNALLRQWFGETVPVFE